MGVASYDFCFKWYILIHYPITFIGVYRLGRYWQLSRTASALSALAWTASGTFWFLACNPIFLIGAAWLPWAVRWGDEIVGRRDGVKEKAAPSVRSRLPSSIKLALVLAVMVLGGDPETAYLTGLFLFGLLCVRFRADAAQSNADASAAAEPTPSRARDFRSGLAALIFSGLLAGLLSAAALIPAAAMERYSDRRLDRSPISLWDIPAAIGQKYVKKDSTVSLSDGFLCRHLDKGGHRQDLYHFSMGPWRLLEWVFPNIGGDWQTNTSRWFMFFPNEEHEDWVPSIYMGAIPFFLAVSFLCAARKKSLTGMNAVRTRALFWAVLIAVLGSFGGFGLVWFFRAAGSFFQSGQSLTISDYDPVGGVYWLMDVLLPKFSTFRYPAKLLTVAAFGLAMLAGFGWDRFFSLSDIAKKTPGQEPKRRVLWRIVLTFDLIAVGLLVFFGLFGLPLLEPFRTKTVSVYVPFDAFACWRLVCQSLFQTSAVLSLFLLLIYAAEKRSKWGRLLPAAILLLTSADIWTAHHDLIPTVSEEEYHRPLLLSNEIHRDQAAADAESSSGPARLYRFVYVDPFSSFIPVADRAAQSFIWNRKTLAPKYPWPEGIGVANVYGTIRAADYAHFLSEIEGMFAEVNRHGEFSDALRKIGVGYVVLPFDNLDGQSVRIDGLVPLDSAMPRQYSLHSDLEKAQKLFDSDWPVNVLLWKFPEPVQKVRIVRSEDHGEPVEGEFAKIVRYEPNSLELSVCLRSPGAVVTAEQYWPGWTATAVSENGAAQEIPIEKEMGVLRKISLPEGQWRIKMSYKPLSAAVGLWVSAAAWLGVFLFGGRQYCLFRRALRRKAKRAEGE